MRLFLGLDVPVLIKKYIHDYLLPLQQSPKGWENPHDYHQTLLFIGEVSDEEAETIKEKMKEITFHSFSLHLDKFYFFNRRIMYLGFERSEDLLELKAIINEKFSTWVKPESRAFVPHITVKRWQRYEYDDLEKGLQEKEFGNKAFKVEGVSLFKSEKDELNRKYHVIFTKSF